jgi:hypothetical protein
LRTVAALSGAGAVPAVLGGAVFWAVQRDTTITHAIASALWFAAAVLFLGMLVTTNKSLWRRTTTIAIPEGWMFLSAAVVLTALGAAIDVA